MQYVLLIYQSEAESTPPSDTAANEMLAEYRGFTNSIKESGNYLGGEALQPVATATTVRLHGGKRLVIDGPFAETREQLAGFYAIEAADLDEAIEIALRIPGARYGSIVIRPVWHLGG